MIASLRDRHRSSSSAPTARSRAQRASGPVRAAAGDAERRAVDAVGDPRERGLPYAQAAR
ncbi:MAG: hypothetical protein MZW92_29325 [Comamonadaceae bacterium]|nr:hypothetical protein [Comamonadaceae bacterium]